VLANDRGLVLEIFSHLAPDPQKGINRLSALAESFLGKLTTPGHAKVCRLHCAFAAVLREVG
jgi:hypothetical protein